MFRIREEGGEPRIRISHRWLAVRPGPPKTKPSDQELLFRLLDLRIRGEARADGEAYLELLREYVDRASKTGIDAERLREYVRRLELLGDEETLREVRALVKNAGRR